MVMTFHSAWKGFEVDKIAVFMTRNGADLQCIIDACADYKIDGAVDFVASTTNDTVGLKRAKDAGINHLHYDPEKFANVEEFYRACGHRIEKSGIKWIFLIEYPIGLPDFFIEWFQPFILGVHPSLDMDMVDLEDVGPLSADAALAEGKKETGLTIYQLKHTSSGTLHRLADERVPIFDDDNRWSVYNRVKKAEHYMIPRVLGKCLAGKYSINENGIIDLD